MTDLPRDARRVINARADDVVTAIFEAYDERDRDGLADAVEELVRLIFDERSLRREFEA